MNITEEMIDWLKAMHLCKDRFQLTYVKKAINIALKKQAEEIFSDIEIGMIQFRGERRKNFTRNDFEKIKKKYLK